MAVIEDKRTFSTVKQVCARYGFKEGTFRHWLAYKQQNGLAACCLQIGKLIMIDNEKIAQWLDSHQVGGKGDE
jgi:hypothetical protein